jgi:hypothetical protein
VRDSRTPSHVAPIRASIGISAIRVVSTLCDSS